jgi:hypothetical protein
VPEAVHVASTQHLLASRQATSNLHASGDHASGSCKDCEHERIPSCAFAAPKMHVCSHMCATVCLSVGKASTAFQ